MKDREEDGYRRENQSNSEEGRKRDYNRGKEDSQSTRCTKGERTGQEQATRGTEQGVDPEEESDGGCNSATRTESEET